MTTIRWYESEWHDHPMAQSAYHRGYSADVTYDTRRDFRGRVYRAKWVWTVEATSAVSEWPELYTLGRSMTREGARKAAEAALRRAAKTAPDRNPTTGELNAWVKEEA